MDNTECCFVCGSFNTELHHIVFRSQNKQLENCVLNHIRLCPEHHRGTNGVHGKKGHKLDKVLKLHFQNTLEIVFFKELLTREEIKEVLDISDKPLNRLLKGLDSFHRIKTLSYYLNRLKLLLVSLNAYLHNTF